jgi:3-methyladenine DNA glycosylase AlkD
MVVKIHYITNWSLKKQVIAFKELPTPHTGINIADQLISTIMEWKLVDKVAFITVDNTSSNNVAVSWVCSTLSSRSSVPPDLDGKFFHV